MFQAGSPCLGSPHFGWLRRLRSAIVLQEDVQEPLPPRKITLYQVGLCPGFSRSLVASVLPRQLQLLCSRCCLHPPTQRQARNKQQPVRLSSSTKRMAPSISIGRDRSWSGWPMICAQRSISTERSHSAWFCSSARLEVKWRRAIVSSRSSTRSSYSTSSSPWCLTASCVRPCAYRSSSKARTVLRRERAFGSSTRWRNGRQTAGSEPTWRRRGDCSANTTLLLESQGIGSKALPP